MKILLMLITCVFSFLFISKLNLSYEMTAIYLIVELIAVFWIFLIIQGRFFEGPELELQIKELRKNAEYELKKGTIAGKNKHEYFCSFFNDFNLSKTISTAYVHRYQEMTAEYIEKYKLEHLFKQRHV